MVPEVLFVRVRKLKCVLSSVLITWLPNSKVNKLEPHIKNM